MLELEARYTHLLQLVTSIGPAPAASFVELGSRVERQHRLKYGEQNLADERADERERDLAVNDPAALIAYETKWSKRLAKLQQTQPARWRVPGLSVEELRDLLTLRLIDAVRTSPKELARHRRPGKEWGFSFLAHQRKLLRRELRLELGLGDEDPLVIDGSPSGEERLIDEQWARLVALASTRAENGLTRPQRRWFAAMKLAASAGEFFESSGKLNLSAVSRLLDKDRSSAQRAFGELRQRFMRELKKLSG